jgi:hypothetical protein
MLHNLKTPFDLKDTSVACAVGPSVTTSSTDFSFQNLIFGIYLNYQQQKSLKYQNLPHFLNPNLSK